MCQHLSPLEMSLMDVPILSLGMGTMTAMTKGEIVEKWSPVFIHRPY